MCASPNLSSLSLAPVHSRPCVRRVRRPLKSCWSSSDQTPAAAAAAVAASGVAAAAVTAAAAAVMVAAAAAATVAAAATHGALQVVDLTAATAPATCLTTKAQGRQHRLEGHGRQHRVEGQGAGGGCVSLNRQQGREDGEKGPGSYSSNAKFYTYSGVEIQPCLLHSQSDGCCDCFDAQLWQVLVGCAMRLARWAHSHLAARLPHSPPPLPCRTFRDRWGRGDGGAPHRDVEGRTRMGGEWGSGPRRSGSWSHGHRDGHHRDARGDSNF